MAMSLTNKVSLHSILLSQFSFVLLLLVALPGCNSEKSDLVELSLWAFGAEGDAARTLIEQFHLENPEIRVRVQQIPWTAAHEKLLTAFAGDSLPDVCQLGNTWIPEFAALGALQPLDEYVGDSEEITAREYFAGIWETNVVDGHVYGIPWYVDTRVMFYRRDLLEKVGRAEPPSTWQDWTEVLSQLREIMPPQGYPLLMPTNEWEPLAILGLQTTDDMLRDGGQWGDFDSDGFRYAFDFYTSFFENRLAPVKRNTEIPNIYQEFERDRFAMYLTGPWNVGEFRKRLPKKMLAKWSTAPLPGPSAETPGVSMAGGCSLVVFKSSQHKPEAWKLIEFMSRPETQLEFYQLMGNLPSRQASWNSSELRGDDWMVAFGEQLEHVEPLPRVPEWERIATKLYEVGEKAVNGRLDTAAALSELNQQTNDILEKRRWILARN